MKANSVKNHWHGFLAAFRDKIIATALLLFFAPAMSFANPTGPQVINGNVGFSTSGNTLTVTNSPGAIINWQGFSIGTNELTRFIQQNSASAVLNRVVGQDPSRILGALQSNGRVFIINPNGIVFGKDAKIDVAGLVASTLHLSNEDFLAGRYNFTAGLVSGAISNLGTITTPAGGMVYFIAPTIENSGIITSPKGEVILAAGRSVQLIDPSRPDIAVTVSAPGDQALNVGQIVAQGGKVGMYGALVSQQGTVSAGGAVAGENGKIYLRASSAATLGAGSVTSASGAQGGEITVRSETGTTMVSGQVSAAGSEGKGGTIELLGEQVGLTGAQVDASGAAGGGAVLVGGGFQGKNPAVQNAKRTFVSADTVINADALQSGDGGKVIVWSDEATRAYGSISAKGGNAGGNGGFVEVSGKQYLDFTARVDTGAPEGKTGTLLLDPLDIVVDVTVPDYTLLTQVDQFADPSIGGGVIAPATLAGAAANVTLQATNSITFNTAVNMANVGVGITAQAGGDITVNAPVTTKGGAISFTAQDPGGNIGNGGAIYIQGTGSLNTTGGGQAGANVTLTNLGAPLAGNAIDVTGNINAGTGTVSINAPVWDVGGTGNITAAGLLLAGGGSFNLNSGLNNIGTIAGNVTGPVTFVNNGGFAVGSVGGTNGLTSGGAISLTSNGGGLIVNDTAAANDISAGGLVTLRSGGIMAVNGKVVGSRLDFGTTAGGNIILGSNGIQSTNAALAATADAIKVAILTATGHTITNSGNITAASGKITLAADGQLDLNAGAASRNITTTGNVSLSSATGGILHSNGASPVSAAALTATAKNGINLAGSAQNVILNNSGAGNIAYTGNTPGGLTIGGTNSAAGGTFSVTENAGNLAVDAGGLTASGPVTLNAAAGAIIGGTVTGTSLAANAVNGITLDGTVPTVSLTNTTSGDIIYTSSTPAGLTVSASNPVGNVIVSEASSNITVGAGNISASGNVILDSSVGAISSGGTVDAAMLIASAATGITLTGNSPLVDLTLNGAGVGDINYTGNTPSGLAIFGSNPTGSFFVTENLGNLTVWFGNISASGSVSLGAPNGVISHFGTVDASSLSATAKYGISLAGSSPTVSLTSTSSGDVTYVGNTVGGLSVDGTATSGNFTVTENLSGLDLGGDITASGAVTLNAPAGAITASVGNVYSASLAATALNGIDLYGTSPTVSLTNTGAGDVYYSGSTPGGLTIRGANAGGNFSVLEDTGDIHLGLIDDGSGIVNITANLGAIINANGTADNIVAGALALWASNGIGSGNALKTRVGTLDAHNNAAGNIEIANTGVLTINTLDNLGADTIFNNYGEATTAANLITATGAITMTAHSPLTIGTGGMSAGGNISLEAAASGSTDNLTINGNVTSLTGGVTLRAGGQIIENAVVSGTPVTRTANLNSPSPTSSSSNFNTLTIAQVPAVGDAINISVASIEEANPLASEGGSGNQEERKAVPEGNGSNGKEAEGAGKQYCN